MCGMKGYCSPWPWAPGSATHNACMHPHGGAQPHYVWQGLTMSALCWLAVSLPQFHNVLRNSFTLQLAWTPFCLFPAAVRWGFEPPVHLTLQNVPSRHWPGTWNSHLSEITLKTH